MKRPPTVPASGNVKRRWVQDTGGGRTKGSEMNDMGGLVLLEELLGLFSVPTFSCILSQSTMGAPNSPHLKSASDDPMKNHSSPSCFPKGELAGSVSITYLMPCPTSPVPPVTRTLTDIVVNACRRQAETGKEEGGRGRPSLIRKSTYICIHLYGRLRRISQRAQIVAFRHHHCEEPPNLRYLPALLDFLIVRFV